MQIYYIYGMRKKMLVVSLILFGIFGCQKDNTNENVGNCPHPIPTKIPPRVYTFNTSFPVEVTYQQSHCGYLPLGKNNYWVFLDSLFDYNTGQFQNTLIDTLRFERTYRALDSIVWWEPKVPSFPAHYKGYNSMMYSTDTVLYTWGDGGPGTLPAVKWCYPLYTDSSHTYPTWGDTGYFESLGYKLYTPVTVPAGVFQNCFLFIQRWNGRGGLYIYVKPGTGILKSRSVGGATGYILTRTSTLLSFHIE